VKVTKEKLPKSLLALDIELDREQVEKGLDRAARQFSQKYNIPGFRKGKAPRFIVENYFGREALLESATEDLINKSFKAALEQEGVEPVAQASIEKIETEGTFKYRVLVPVEPTVVLPDHRAIRLPLEIEEITDKVVEEGLESLREKHVVLRELEEPRPAQDGDQLTVRLESFVDGKALEERPEGQEVSPSTLVLSKGKVVDELYDALIGAEVGQQIETVAQMPEDHANEEVSGKQVTFKVQIDSIQERILPEWDELPVLENFEGTLDELRAKTRKELEESAKNVGERNLLDSYIRNLVEATDFDVPDALIHDQAHNMLHEQAAQFERYGITLDQMLQYRGKSHDEAVEELVPQAEEQLKTTLALQEVVKKEQLTVTPEEVDAEIEKMVNDYETEDEKNNARLALRTQLYSQVANMVLDRKLRERIIAIAQGQAPELSSEAAAEPAAESAEEAPASE
jgi:trigger factor